MGHDRKLPPKRALFVKEYLVDFNGTQAAIRAGYAPRTAKQTACELLTFPDIQTAIQKEREKRNARVEVSQDWVLKRLKLVVKRCLEEIPILDREGNETGVFRFEASGANKALELIGRHLAMFTDKLDVKHTLLDEVLEELDGKTRGLPKETGTGGGNDD